jgi:signal transduction histidine kinase
MEDRMVYPTSLPGYTRSQPVLECAEEREVVKVRSLLTYVVHDMRTPLHSMLAGLSLIYRQSPPESLSPATRLALEAMTISCQQLMAMTDRVLEAARPQTGPLALRRHTVNLNELVDEIIVELTPLARERGLILTGQLSPDLPELCADRDHIRRVLINLLGNAIKFTPPGGRVAVCGALVNVARGKRLLCSVLDTGPGIDEADRRLIFEPYARTLGNVGDNSGYGLGLAFCRLAVEAHGGQIWVENRPEGGSAFYFTLPVEATKSLTE